MIRSEIPLFDAPRGKPKGTVMGGYKVLDLKDQWVKVSYLDPTDPSQREFPPVGWIQWVCSDGLQIFIADDTWMEDYYHGYGGWMEDQP
ncbi:MAG: hypothetical protein LPK28_03390 [Bacteroidota bacterium]|nr:hypothetical protein [Bacteroidota bacterium]